MLDLFIHAASRSQSQETTMRKIILAAVLLISSQAFGQSASGFTCFSQQSGDYVYTTCR
jgi:hypothetical protein